MDAMQSARGGFNPNSSRPGNAWECADCDYACGSETGLKRHLNKASHSMTPVTERTGVQTTIEDAIAMGQEATDNATGPIAVIEGTPPQVHDPTWSPDTQRVVTPETRPQPGTSSLHDAIEYVHTERAVARIDSMRLPKPDEFEADPPKRPVDMSKCSTEELRSLYSSFNACSAYARYHLALEEAKADDCKRILARKESQIVTSLNALDIHGKPKTVTTLKNEAFNSSEELRQWAERQAEHIATAKLLRAMLESYDLDCTRISRDLAQRQAELAHS